jgi:hypothetical protein
VNTASLKSFYANIWIGGDYAEAIAACRRFCQTTALCVTVTPAAYVYVGGMEEGVCVRLLQYPRFPESEDALRNTARLLAAHLRDVLCQRSFSIEFPDVTEYDSVAVAR